MERVRDLASKKAAVIFTKTSCCIKTLFYELDKDPQGCDMGRSLFRVFCSNPAIPAVFVGSAKDGISFHVDGSLKQMLKDSKAIWLSPNRHASYC
ncbi:putative glutaredoxin-C12 [Cardamine amara subsp. amara]|uniref:Glutaredoxin-C12 n=1 Tax=Cardamine amara subsp. amara TaxID=228776 RepID=A0ABD1CA40_CARAN